MTIELTERQKAIAAEMDEASATYDREAIAAGHAYHDALDAAANKYHQEIQRLSALLREEPR